MKLGQNVYLDKISHDLKIGHVGSKTRSLDQILEKPCVCFQSHILDLILMKLGQIVCLDKSQMSLQGCKIFSLSPCPVGRVG